MPRRKVLWVVVTVGDDRVASSRVRARPFVVAGEAAGYRVRRIEASRRSWPLHFAGAVFSRPDLLIVQKVPLPRVLLGIGRLFSRRLVLELDDAIYFGYPGAGEDKQDSIAKRVRALAMKADLVTTTSAIIADDLRIPEGKLLVFPGPSPRESLLSAPSAEREGVIWLGSPSTFDQVQELVPILRDLDSPVWLVGAPTGERFGNVETIVWSEMVQSSCLSSARVGLMPLKRSAWNDRKAAYKVLEYLANGIIPVVSDVPSVTVALGPRITRHCIIVRGGETGAWRAAIDEALNKQIDDSWAAEIVGDLNLLSEQRFVAATLEACR